LNTYDEKDKAVTKKIADYMFKSFKNKDNGDNENENKFLDTRCRVFNKELYNAISYYRILEEQYECKAAGDIANILERLSISKDGDGRLEGFGILKGNTPKQETILRGLSEELKKQMENEE
jgi:hypothetical protein